MKTLFAWALLFLSFSALAQNASDLLRPEQAFKLTIEPAENSTLRATWTIADGYYLYRDKLSFSSETTDIALGEISKPEGLPKKDPNFGEVSIYRNSASFDIPVNRSNDTTPQILDILAKSQGCADIGLCYPPQKTKISVELPGTGLPETTSTPIKSITSQLGIDSISGDTGMNEPLHPDDAFRLDLSAFDANTINARWNIVPGHYLYKGKISFSLTKDSKASLGKPDLPKGKEYNDVYFGDVAIYEEDFDARVPINNASGIVPVKVTYQGCSKITGICYPPQDKEIDVDFSDFKKVADPEQTTAATQSATPPANAQTAVPVSTTVIPQTEETKLGDLLKTQNWLAIISAFFVGGLLLTFTPCVFPMIPILSRIITGQGENISRGRSFTLSVAYVIPMALTYAAAGVIAGYTGTNLQAALQNPWVISVFAFLFVLLSLSMFGFYELQMPAFIQNRLNNMSNSQQGGNIVGAGIMGVLSALIVGPCVTAPLIAALAYIANTKDMVLGGVSLFALGLGMGAPLLLIGITAGSILPKAGAWMDTVKHVFGVIMLGMAIWMLDRVVPPEITLLLTGMLLIASAMYLGATDSTDATSTGWSKLWKGTGIISMLLGALLIIGAAAGSKNLTAPLSGLFASQQINVGNNLTTAANASQTAGVQFRKIKGLNGLNAVLSEAKANGQSVMLDFYAYWCLPCREMEHSVFSSPDVKQLLGNTITIQADVTEMDAQDSELMKSLGIFGPPQVVFYNTQSEELRPYRVSGEMKLEPFKKHVQQLLPMLNNKS